MIKISHESPISLLELSKKYNDYDYALVHLFDKYPKYLKFFEESIKSRIMYLDNSIFELGEAFDIGGFKEWCNHFCDINEGNFYYIVPDVLEDCEKTIQNFDNFKFGRGHRIGVCQGKTKSETLECFDYLKDKCDIVAISFDYSWFGDNETPLVIRMWNRVQFIRSLKYKGLLNNVKLHLLGCYLPQEFKYYKDIPEIVSLDTSNPVVHGLKKISYTVDGLISKESQKLVDLIESEEIPIQVFQNIQMFRGFVK